MSTLEGAVARSSRCRPLAFCVLWRAQPIPKVETLSKNGMDEIAVLALLRKQAHRV